MAVPTYDQLIAPLLKVLAAHPDGIKIRDAYDAVAEEIGLTDEEKRELLPSGKQPVYMNRIGWANDRLKRAGLARSPADVPATRTWQLTDRGIALAREYPNGLDPAATERLAKVPADSTVSGGLVGSTQGSSPPAPPETETPDARIDDAARELHASLSTDLLAEVGKMPPIRFEGFVLELLHRMGYGTSRSDLTQTPASGDGGVDGIITLDRLGLEKVYVQAKRWNSGTVGRPEIQRFVGALAGHGGTRGVFITTSSFSAEARQYADQVPNSLVLIDGTELASLMIECGVGVTVQRVVKIAQLDSDYFED